MYLTMTKTVDQLESEIQTLRTEISNLRSEFSSSVKSQKPKKPRKPSKFNEFMKTEIASVKAANEGISHADAFKMAAANWKLQKTEE